MSILVLVILLLAAVVFNQRIELKKKDDEIKEISDFTTSRFGIWKLKNDEQSERIIEKLNRELTWLKEKEKEHEAAILNWEGSMVNYYAKLEKLYEKDERIAKERENLVNEKEKLLQALV